MTAIQDRSTEAKARLRLWLQLLKTSRRIEAVVRENLRLEFSGTLPRFDVMAALARYDKGLKMSELSAVLKVSNGNVTGIIDRLVADGCVRRAPVPGDRRACRVRLTGKGRQLFSRQAQAHEGWINDLLAGFSHQEAQDVCDRLNTMGHTFTGAKDSK